MKNVSGILGLIMFIILIHACKKDVDNSIKDIDGNGYMVVTIGTQVWMAENLKTTKYNDGTPIPNITDKTAWAALTTGAYSDYINTPANSTTYGRLYTWYAVTDRRKVCPTGWHVPTDAEWTTLTTYLGGEYVAGGKLKEFGTAHWKAPNTSATNETGFTALPGGYRSYLGACLSVGYLGLWWSSSGYSATSAFDRNMSSIISEVIRLNYIKNSGLSVRCIKD